MIGDGARDEVLRLDAVLPAGRYDLYVRVVLNHDDGTASESIGDPRPLVLR